MTTETTIFCTAQIRKLWPEPLADQWFGIYPDLFDEDDLRLTKTQPQNHFCEWFAAIHLFHCHGAYSLVEKYGATTHPKKLPIFETLLNARRRKILDDICYGRFSVQPPDLLVYTPDRQHCWFVEVKGPRDRIADKQRRSHTAIRQQLKVPVNLISVQICR